MMYSRTIPTEHGIFLASYSDLGLRELRFPGNFPSSHSAVPTAVQAWHAVTDPAVGAILAGRAPEAWPVIDLSGHTLFRRSVWQELQKIGIGETLSYAEVAERIGNPNAARAVGNACGANPIPLLIPCHRVLAAGKGLGGFSGGLDWKRKLLAIEGATGMHSFFEPLLSISRL